MSSILRTFRPPEPAVRLEDDGRSITLLEPLSYCTSGGIVHTAPAGLRCDGASIPRALWSLIGSPYTGDYRLAAIMHDSLCQQASEWGGRAGLRLRQYADGLFGEMAGACGAGAFQRAYLVAGVRLGTLWTIARGDWRVPPAPDGVGALA